MTVIEYHELKSTGKGPELLDVREADEFVFTNIGGIHIPLSELATRYQELNPDKEYVVLCHHGVRSAHAVGFLKQQGFKHVHNISGGIEAWSLQIDPTVPRY